MGIGNECQNWSQGGPMKKLPSAKVQAIQEINSAIATIGFMAFASSLLLIQGLSRLLTKNL